MLYILYTPAWGRGGYPPFQTPGSILRWAFLGPFGVPPQKKGGLRGARGAPPGGEGGTPPGVGGVVQPPMRSHFFRVEKNATKKTSLWPRGAVVKISEWPISVPYGRSVFRPAGEPTPLGRGCPPYGLDLPFETYYFSFILYLLI